MYKFHLNPKRHHPIIQISSTNPKLLKLQGQNSTFVIDGINYVIFYMLFIGPHVAKHLNWLLLCEHRSTRIAWANSVIKEISKAIKVKLNLPILTFCLLDGENISINFFEDFFEVLFKNCSKTVYVSRNKLHYLFKVKKDLTFPPKLMFARDAFALAFFSSLSFSSSIRLSSACFSASRCALRSRFCSALLSFV